MRKLKTLGIGLLTVGAVSAAGSMAAPAKTGGHFVSEVSHTIVNQSASSTGPHALEFSIHGMEGGIVCDQLNATGTASTATVTEEIGNLILNQCRTTGQQTSFDVDENGCYTRVTVAPGEPATTEHTNDFICAVGSFEITHPNCLIRIPAQNNLGGLTYTRVTDNGKHAITVDVATQFEVQFHGGICVFLGTTKVGTMNGSTIVRALNTEGKQVSVTAT